MDAGTTAGVIRPDEDGTKTACELVLGSEFEQRELMRSGFESEDGPFSLGVQDTASPTAPALPQPPLELDLEERNAHESLALERMARAQERAQLASDRECLALAHAALARERASVAGELRSFRSRLAGAVEEGCAAREAELELAHAGLDRDRDLLVADREALALDRAAFEKDRRALALDRAVLERDRATLQEQVDLGVRASAKIVIEEAQRLRQARKQIAQMRVEMARRLASLGQSEAPPETAEEPSPGRGRLLQRRTRRR